MMKKTMGAVVICVLGALACGGTSSESGGTALQNVASAFCSRTTSCCSNVTPTGCQAIFDSLYVQAGFDTSSNYATDSVNQCTSELGALACPVSSVCSFVLPQDCPGHGHSITITAEVGDASTD